MTTTTREIDDYVTAVHAALADLPDAEREDLLDDLPQHLADVLAEGGGTLTEVLGTPGSYAAELRASAGLEAQTHRRPWWPALLDRLDRADRRLGYAFGYERFGHLVRALGPAWWVIRGWLVAEALTGATSQSGRRALLPAVGGNWIAGVALLVVAVVGSVWLGRRIRPRTWQRNIVAVLGLALAVYGVVVVRHALEPRTYYVDYGNADDGTAGLSNIYPVAPDGTVLKNIRLYDQDGNPVVLGNAVCDDGSGVGDGGSTFNVDGSVPAASASPASSDGAALYPLSCAANQGPFGPSSHAAALPSAATPSSSVPVSGSPTPRPSVTPTASPTR